VKERTGVAILYNAHVTLLISAVNTWGITGKIIQITAFAIPKISAVMAMIGNQTQQNANAILPNSAAHI
jgi:hypothetical protein